MIDASSSFFFSSSLQLERRFRREWEIGWGVRGMRGVRVIKLIRVDRDVRASRVRVAPQLLIRIEREKK